MARKRLRKFSDQLRRKIDASGHTRYRICKECKIGQNTLSRFMTGKGSLGMENIDKICKYLRLEIKDFNPEGD